MAPNAPATAGAPLDVAALTAHPWATDEACTDRVTFNPDGTMAMEDYKRWRWALAGDTLTLSSEGGSDESYTIARTAAGFTMTTQPRSQNTMYACPAG